MPNSSIFPRALTKIYETFLALSSHALGVKNATPPWIHRLNESLEITGRQLYA